MLIKTPLLHQSSGPRVLLSLSLSQAISLECRGSLSSLSYLGFQDPLEKALCAFTPSRGHLRPPWTEQASCRQEYWSGLPFPSPGNLPNTGIEPMSLTLQVGFLPLSHRAARRVSQPYVLLTPFISKCGPWTCTRSIIWEFARNAEA